MSKKDKDESMRASAVGGALGIAAGASAASIPTDKQADIVPENPVVIDTQPQPTPQPVTPPQKPIVEEEPIDVLHDPDNPIDIEAIASEIGSIAQEPIPIDDPFICMYGPPIIEPEYAAPMDDDYIVDPWDNPIENVYAGPIPPGECILDDDYDDLIDDITIE